MSSNPTTSFLPSKPPFREQAARSAGVLGVEEVLAELGDEGPTDLDITTSEGRSREVRQPSNFNQETDPILLVWLDSALVPCLLTRALQYGTACPVVTR
jgi:hypothetical protein